ncbi:MAG: aspartate-semialdehyde dehydrogenase [Nitrospirae bacterium]|nr:aspartate-semialdehyde dehydrogenase [Nitrospirota bacterium]
MSNQEIGYRVAVVGATGAVGREMVSILEERNFPVSSLHLFSSERSAGERVSFKGESVVVRSMKNPRDAKDIDIALFSAGSDVSEALSPEFVRQGTLVIDNSSAFRMVPQVPLVVPEVNPEALPKTLGPALVANPNCATIQMVVALKPLIDRAGVRRIVVSTYQSVSGTGKKAMDELSGQIALLLNGRVDDIQPEVYAPYQIAFNVLPQIDRFLPDGSTKEEEKMKMESRKILGISDLRVSATTVRVPVLIGHSEAVSIEFERPLSPDEARAILAKAPGVRVFDDPSRKLYPVPREVAGQDDVFVGRIRQDDSVEHGLNLWIVGDNLRKGAALNAVQIAERVVSGEA